MADMNPCKPYNPKGALVSGIVAAILSGLALTASGLTFLYLFVILFFQVAFSGHDHYNLVKEAVELKEFWYTSASIVFFLVEFSFSVALCFGASKSKPGHLLVYLIYSSVKLIATLVVTITLFLMVPWWVPGTVGAIYSVLTAVMILEVFKSYKRLKGPWTMLREENQTTQCLKI